MNINMKNNGNENMPSIGLLGKLSIKKKLVIIIMLVSSVALLLAGGSFIIYEWFSLRHRMVDDLTVHAEMLADNCIGSLSFDDPLDAEEVLNSLRVKSPIEFACVYREDGKVFAVYQRDNIRQNAPPVPTQEEYRFGNGRLVMFKQVILNNQPIGTVYLQSDLSELSAFLRQSVIALAIIILISFVLAYVLASLLQKVVSTPIFYLAKIASIVTQKGDYSVRAIKHSKDELGVLTDAFNNMLIQVEKREISLRENEEKYRSLFEAAGDAISISKVTEEGKNIIVDCNQYTLDLLGCSREDIIGKSVEEFSPSVQPDGRSSHEVISEIANAALNGKPQFIELTHSKLDGTLFDAEVTINRLDIEKEPYLQAITRDVTKRKRAEEALRESEETALALLNATTDSVLLIDRDGLIIGLNNNMAGSLGRTSEDLIGTNIYAYLPVDIAEQRKAKGLEAARTRKPVLFEDQQRGRWLENSVFPVYNSRGEVVRYAIYSCDITERKRAEKELENYRGHLEELVKERTEELEAAQEELVRKERLAVMGQLTATVSHELRNPLGTILSSVYSIREHLHGKGLGVDRALDRVERNIYRCVNIIDELLFYSRKRDLNLEPTLFDTWLDKVLDEQKIPDGITLKRELAAGIEIPLDRERFRRCIVNVINNANEALIAKDAEIQEKHEGQIAGQLTIETHIKSDSLVVRIIDAGPGIPGDEYGKTFEPLYSTKSFGIGLGLTITKQIVEQHGGEIDIKSERGKGTTVTMLLPIKTVNTVQT